MPTDNFASIFAGCYLLGGMKEVNPTIYVLPLSWVGIQCEQETNLLKVNPQCFLLLGNIKKFNMAAGLSTSLSEHLNKHSGDLYCFSCAVNSFLGCVDKIGIAFEAPTIATGFGAYLAQVRNVLHFLFGCLPSLWTGVRLRVILLWHKPCCFSNVNYFVIMLDTGLKG